MARFEGVEILLQEGDILSSKKGILIKGSLSGGSYIIKKTKYLGGGRWLTIGDKEPVDVTPVDKTSMSEG